MLFGPRCAIDNVIALIQQLKELRNLRYRQAMSLEYEEHPENPIAYIEECLAATREAVKQLGPPA